MWDWFKEWKKEEGKETEKRIVKEKGMMRNKRLIYGMTEGRRWGNWETKSKRKREWWGMKYWLKEWQKEEG